jgi:siroheme synthase
MSKSIIGNHTPVGVDVDITQMHIFTVGGLIKALQESGCPPDTPVWLVGMHARPAKSFTITTVGDPVTGRMSGDPSGPTVVVIE